MATAVETSPLGRARQTAEIICAELGLDSAALFVAPLLVEHDLGRWAGLTADERDALFPGAREARKRDKWNYVVPGGESYAAALFRAREWLAARRHTPVTIAVTHEMISRTIQGAYLGLEPAGVLRRSHPHDRVYRLRDGSIEDFGDEMANEPDL